MSRRVKRRSRSSPPEPKRTHPGSPGPYTEDLFRADRQDRFPGAFPTSVKKVLDFRQQLFMTTRGQEATASQASLAAMSTSSPSDDAPRSETEFTAPLQVTPPHVADDLIEELPRNPQEPRQPAGRRGNPPDLQDVVTQQTEILENMMRALQRAQPAVQQDPAEPPPDPHFAWERLCLPSETNFRVPGEGMVQRMATSLLAKLPTLSGRDQHEARIILQVTSLWPDLSDDDRKWLFQRLNVYCIVAALGWPAATAACASSMATTDFVLPPGLVLPQQEPRMRNRRNDRDQQPLVNQPQPDSQFGSRDGIEARPTGVAVLTKTRRIKLRLLFYTLSFSYLPLSYILSFPSSLLLRFIFLTSALDKVETMWSLD